MHGEAGGLIPSLLPKNREDCPSQIPGDRHAPITRRWKALLASPASLATRQEYTPVSAGPTAAKLSRGPAGTRLLCRARGSPSFSQVTAGAGDPVASQVKVTSEPSPTICSSLLSGLSRTGGTGEGAVPP